MIKLMKSVTKFNWSKIYIVLEYVIAGYVVLTSVVNLLNLAGIISFEKWVMQPTFWGASLLVLMLLQYGLVVSNRECIRLTQIRPYIVGLMVAGVISAGNVPLILLLFLILGYFLMTGFGRKFDLKIATLVALVACVGIEVCSVARLLAEASAKAQNDFAYSIWPDVLFVVTAIVYCVVNKEDACDTGAARESGNGASGEATDENASEVVEQTKEPDGVVVETIELKETSTEGDTTKEQTKESALRGKMSAKVKPIVTWFGENSGKVARYLGGSVCVLSLALFLFGFVTTSAGENKIANTTEEVYLLQNCEDNSLVLTLVEDAANETYTVVFAEYTGTNNQKVRLQDRGDGLYQLVFVENDYALDVTLDEKSGAYILGASPVEDIFRQCWLKQDFVAAEDMYRFYCAYSIPLCYPMLGDAKEVPELSVQADTGWYEFFRLERTVADEFVTKMVCRYGASFTPTLLMETIIGYLGGLSFVVFLAIVLMICALINSRRVVGDKPAVLYTLVFVFLLAYASISAIALFVIVFGLLYVNAYMRKYEKQKVAAFKRYNENLTDVARAEMFESLDAVEKALQEVRALLKK